MAVRVNARRIERLLPTPEASATKPHLQLGIGDMGEGGGDIPATGTAPAAPRDSSATPDVFISYASPDVAVADAVCTALERGGVTCWVAPRDVLPGDFYADAIVRAIDVSKAIIIVLSQSAVASPHVLRVLGQRPEADALLTEAQSKYGDSHAYGIADSYALRDQKDEAFKWLDRSVENGEAQPSLMRSDRALRGLRADPRFDALLRKMNLL
jgi:hypothetical protein